MSGPTSLPASNAEFLTAIFGALPAGVAPHVCGFAGNPKPPTPTPGERARWTGWPWVAALPVDEPTMNWYFTLATFRLGENGKHARKRSLCTAVHGVMLDDIGTKAATRERLAGLPPFALIETSPGNYQALYLFGEPVTDLQTVNDLQGSLIAAGLCDPGAHGPTARWCRMPHAVNGKHAPPFPCHLIEWRPTARYTVEQMRAGLALPPPAPKATKNQGDEEPRQDWLQRSEQQRAELVADLRSALEVLPSDDRREWIKYGHCLRASLPDDVGLELWSEWSRKAANCDEADLEYRYSTFDPLGAGYSAILAAAQAAGWVNPRSGTPPLTNEQMFGIVPTAWTPPPLPDPPVPLPPFVEVPIDDLAHAHPEPQVWWCDAYVPAGHVTLLGGHGGAGKSTLALMLAASIATGRPFLGLPTKPGRVLVFSAEDPGSLVRRRLAKVCREFGLDPAALAPSLRVLDATEPAPVLFTEQRAHGMRLGMLTSTYQALLQYVTANAIDVVMVDNASDTFDADEINRASVREFIRSLALLVRARGGAVVLLAHVDKSTSRAGKSASVESYSGSTAWHNSVRSRLFFVETGPGRYELQHQKSNLGRRLDPMALDWPADGLPRVAAAAAPQPLSGPDDDLRALLALIDEYAQRGEYPSTAQNGRPNVAGLFKTEPTYPRHLDYSEVFDLIRSAERRGLLEREEFKKANRQAGERFAISEAGRLFMGTAPSALCAPSAFGV